MSTLTQEKKVLEHLGKAYNAFESLERKDSQHPADLPEFVQAIHAAQNVVLARIGQRELERLAPPDPLQHPGGPPEHFGFPRHVLEVRDEHEPSNQGDTDE